MTRADFPVVLDACVLANYPVCNLFLRLAESPRLYIPKWSDEILRETYTTHVSKLDWPLALAASFQEKVRDAFPDACIGGFEALIPNLENDVKDRHVLAAAIRGKVEVIVTFNLRDFPARALEPWDIRAVHPSEYLITLYRIDPVGVLHRLNAKARKRHITVEQLLEKLAAFVPGFCQVIADQLRISEIPLDPL